MSRSSSLSKATHGMRPLLVAPDPDKGYRPVAWMNHRYDLQVTHPRLLQIGSLQLPPWVVFLPLSVGEPVCQTDKVGIGQSKFPHTLNFPGILCLSDVLNIYKYIFYVSILWSAIRVWNFSKIGLCRLSKVWNSCKIGLISVRSDINHRKLKPTKTKLIFPK